MKRCFFHLLLFFYCQGIQAQLLIPFLGQNGKYGFADEQGQVIHAPVFDDVVEPFAENTIAVDCHKNREPVRLFRSGLVVPNPRLQMGRVLTVLNVGFNNILIDSFDHLVAMRVGTTFRIIDLRAEGKTVETFQEDYLNLPRWAKTPGFSLSNGSDFRFQHGLLKVFRSDGRVNFVDKNLREILSKDVAAGFVADEQHLVVAESDGRFGVVDRSGKVLIAPVFKNLEPSGLAGLFIGNKSQGSVIENKACGLVRTDGAIVLDTVYSDIEKVDGAELLLVRKGRKTGLYDLKGHLIEPIEAEYIYNQNFGFLISKWPNGEGMNLINRHGKRLFAQNAAEITPIKLANSLFFKVKSQGWTTILDTAMMVLARDSVENLDLIDTNPFLFMVRKNVSQSRLVSIQDAAGKIIVENKFDGLWSPQGWPDGLRFTYLNNLKGISDRHFNQILPPIFEEIALEEGRLDTFIWAKKKGEALYVPYDKKGKRRSDIDNAPAPRQESAQRVIGKMQSIPGGGNMATMFDGAQIRWPDSLDGQRPWATFRSSSAGALVIGFDPKTITAVLDHRFRNLLPPGFGVPENSADEQVLERFQQFGLLVIKKLPEVKAIAQPTPKPSPKPAEPIKNEPESVIADTPPPELVFSEEFSPSSRSSINTPATGAACGVIDWQGKWILEPKIGVEFLVLSPFLIAEFPAGARSSSHTLYEKGLRLHRVQQDEKGYLETNWLGRDRFSVHEGNTMRIGRFRKNSIQQIEFSYIDQKGKLLTDWIWQEGPDYLASKNLVQFWGKDPLTARQAIIDAQGKTLFQLGDLMTDDPPHDRTDPWKINYLVVRKRVDAENLPEGLMDSTGNLVLPLAYNDLHVWQDGRFLTAKTTAGNTVLMTIDGKILHEFKPSNASILMQHVGPDNHGTGIGPIAIWIGAETILIDENNRVLHQFDLPYGRVFLSEKMARQYVVLIRNKQKIWANYRSGKLFVE